MTISQKTLDWNRCLCGTKSTRKFWGTIYSEQIVPQNMFRTNSEWVLSDGVRLNRLAFRTLSGNCSAFISIRIPSDWCGHRQKCTEPLECSTLRLFGRSNGFAHATDDATGWIESNWFRALDGFGALDGFKALTRFKAFIRFKAPTRFRALTRFKATTVSSWMNNQRDVRWFN